MTGGDCEHPDLVPVELQQSREVITVRRFPVETDAGHLRPGIVRHPAAVEQLVLAVHHLNEKWERTVGVTESDVDGSLDHLCPGVVAQRVLPGRAEHQDLPHSEHDGGPRAPRTEVAGTAGEVRHQLAGGHLGARAVLGVQLVMGEEEGEPVELQPLLAGLPATVEEIISIQFLHNKYQFNIAACSRL